MQTNSFETEIILSVSYSTENTLEERDWGTFNTVASTYRAVLACRVFYKHQWIFAIFPHFRVWGTDWSSWGHTRCCSSRCCYNFIHSVHSKTAQRIKLNHLCPGKFRAFTLKNLLWDESQLLGRALKCFPEQQSHGGKLRALDSLQNDVWEEAEPVAKLLNPGQQSCAEPAPCEPLDTAGSQGSPQPVPATGGALACADVHLCRAAL